MTQPLDADNELLGPFKERPRLCADVMLGRLAKWLRILGFDVLYSNEAQDDELIENCRSEGRILLTRDTALARKAERTLEVLFVTGDHIKEQFASIRHRLPITLEPAAVFSRCVVCNTPLVPATRAEVEGLVPAFVFNTNKTFKICPGCRKVYWKGSHVEHALRTVLVSFSGFNSGDQEPPPS
ncbi:MAG: Mut7-C RNAse domain-containing protein [Candidatus Coatesbacteria bacterium]|nr:Mut7-C RNAse domain-containing protein [Candidatus Coatesbacteria bacterium]